MYDDSDYENNYHARPSLAKPDHTKQCTVKQVHTHWFSLITKSHIWSNLVKLESCMTVQEHVQSCTTVHAVLNDNKHHQARADMNHTQTGLIKQIFVWSYKVILMGKFLVLTVCCHSRSTVVSYKSCLVVYNHAHLR